MSIKQSHKTGQKHDRHDTASHETSSLVQPLHTSVKGRARFNISPLYRCEIVKSQLEDSLGRISGIRSVQANVLTGNILLLFDNGYDEVSITRLLQTHLESTDYRAYHNKRKRTHGGSNITSVIEHRRKRSDRRPHNNTHNSKDSHTPDTQSQHLQNWHSDTANSALGTLDSSKNFGLSDKQVKKLYKQYGPNQLPTFESRSRLEMLFEQFFNLPVGLLGASALISVMTGGVIDAAVIMGVVGINAAIGYFTELQAEKTIGALIKPPKYTARVLREGLARQIAAEDVVIGDILILAPGAYIAADARLIQSHQLTLDESSLTGESMPVIKMAKHIVDEDTPLGERSNMVYMGTTVTGGSGVGVVVATAAYTELGRIQSMVGTARPPETPMQQQLGSMGTQLALLSGAICAGVFVFGLLRGYGRVEMLKSAISLAVAAVPEGLPAVATTTLAIGIQNMRKHRVAIRHLDAVETLGAVQVFCLDKTGTLTLNRMTVMSIYTDTTPVVINEGNFISAGKVINVSHKDELLRLLQIVTLCNESNIKGELNTDTGELSLDGSATENALLEAAIFAGIEVDSLRQQFPRKKIRYRSEGQPYMTSTHRVEDGRQLTAVKGSPDVVLEKCQKYMHEGDIIDLDDAKRDSILRENENMAGNALRVLGVAYAETENDVKADENDMVWLGLIAMADPLRTGMKDLMAVFHKAGIRTVMITGDQGNTAYAIGKELDLSHGKPLEILDSTRLDKIDPALLSGIIREVHIFARVSPAHKLQIVEALQRAGNVVAMTGDGINDGPALKAANIGVAMGRSGTDVARSVSDVVLQDDNLDTMVVAVSQGRSIYSNIRKTIHFLLATNFSEIEVMLAGIAFGLGQPLNPMQLLWINLISDIFPGLALSLESAEPDVLERDPRDKSETIIRKKDLGRMGIESAVITAGTMASYAYALSRYGSGPRASTVAFTTLSTGQLIHAISCRSNKSSIFRPGDRPSNGYLNLALGGSLAAQLLIGLSPAARRLLGTTPLGLIDGLVVAAGAILPLLINEFGKQIPLDNLSDDSESSESEPSDEQTMEANHQSSTAEG